MDRRRRFSISGSVYKKFHLEPSRTHAEVQLGEDDDGNAKSVRVPVTFQICETCDGRGVHANPSIDENGITEEEFDQDPDFREHYFRGGYDVKCYECGGNKVIPVLDFHRADSETRKLMEQYQEEEQEREAFEAEYRREVEAERRFGC